MKYRILQNGEVAAESKSLWQILILASRLSEADNPVHVQERTWFGWRTVTKEVV